MPNDKGLARPAPILNAIRQETAILARVLSGIQMSPETAGKAVSKVRAGNASWAARVARETQREQAG